MRLVITGSRYHTNSERVISAFMWALGDDIFRRDLGEKVLAQGCCRGVDSIIKTFAYDYLLFDVYPFHPENYGSLSDKRTYAKRNQAMVDWAAKGENASCIAILKKGEQNKGTLMTIGMAEKAGLKVFKYTI